MVHRSRVINSVDRTDHPGSHPNTKASRSMVCHRPWVLLIPAMLACGACERLDTIENFYTTFSEAMKTEAAGDDR